ncbi:MAG: hypothetical protein GXY83_14740 [Rhodopirellula sp.]|nr:hypothetical protein [Rhodopirellula sp.]
MNKATDAFRRVVDDKVGQPWRRLRATAIVLALLGRSLLAGESPTSSMRFSGEPPGVASASSQGSLDIRVRNAADSRAHGTDMQPQGTAAPFTSPEAAEMWYAGKRVDSGNREAGKSDEAARGTQQSTAPLPPDLGLNTDRPNSESPSPDGTKRDQFGLPPAPFSRALSHERLQQFHGAFRNAEAYEVETHRPETSPADGWFLEWPGYGPRRRSSTFPNPLRIRPLLNDSTGISDGASWLLAGRGLPGEDENANLDDPDLSRGAEDRLASFSASKKGPAVPLESDFFGVSASRWAVGLLVLGIAGMACSVIVLAIRLKHPYPSVMQIELVNAKDLGQQLGLQFAGNSVTFSAHPVASRRGGEEAASAWAVDADLSAATAMPPLSFGPTYADRQAEEAKKQEERDQNLLKALFEHNLRCLSEIDSAAEDDTVAEATSLRLLRAPQGNWNTEYADREAEAGHGSKTGTGSEPNSFCR